MNNVKLLHIKCCFFQFFNSPVALKNIKKIWPPQEKVEMTPLISLRRATRSMCNSEIGSEQNCGTQHRIEPYYIVVNSVDFILCSWMKCIWYWLNYTESSVDFNIAYL